MQRSIPCVYSGNYSIHVSSWIDMSKSFWNQPGISHLKLTTLDGFKLTVHFIIGTGNIIRMAGSLQILWIVSMFGHSL